MEVDMNSNRLTDKQLKAYAEDGYLLVRGMLDPDEVAMLGRYARKDRVLDQHSFGRADGEGGPFAYHFGTTRPTRFME